MKLSQKSHQSFDTKNTLSSVIKEIFLLKKLKYFSQNYNKRYTGSQLVSFKLLKNNYFDLENN